MKTAIVRFWENIGPHNDPNSCWLWLGATNKSKKSKHPPYGQISVNGRRVLVHRFSYEFFVGPIPKGLTIDHVVARGCTSTLCVNPNHLEAVSQKENVHRGNGTKCLKVIQHIQGPDGFCLHGHHLTVENVRYTASGQLVCRMCMRDYQRSHRAACKPLQSLTSPLLS